MKFLVTLLTLLLGYTAVLCDDDDDDVKGPLMPQKPDGGLFNTAEIIQERKFSSETHKVTTEDGYILTLFRIVPTKQPASVVLLQHGYMASTDCWVSDVDALALKLAEAGFDVWLNNVRGNAYSRHHVSLKPDQDKAFWNFSFHEMGTQDVPAVIDYIQEKTGQLKLHYIGHSLGSTVGFVMTSIRPEYNAKLKTFVALAPAVFLSKLSGMLGPDGMVEDMANKYMSEFKAADKWEVFPRKDVAVNNKTQITCEDMEDNFRPMCISKLEMFQDVLGGAYLPAGVSYRTMVHMYQLSATGQMKHYKFDTPEENVAAYGSEEPPAYTDKFKDISVPVLLWSSVADGMIEPKDIDDLVPLLPNVVADNRITEECFDHTAFLFARKKSCAPVREKLCMDVIEALKKLDAN